MVSVDVYYIGSLHSLMYYDRSLLTQTVLIHLLKYIPTVMADDDVNMALWDAAGEGTIADMERALRNGANVNHHHHYRETPLMNACFKNKPDNTAWLIDHGAVVDDVNRVCYLYCLKL